MSKKNIKNPYEKLNLPNNLKRLIQKKSEMISLLGKNEIISYLKTLSKKDVINSLNIGTLNFLVNKKERQQNIENKLEAFNFENIIRNKAIKYYHMKITKENKASVKNNSKLDALSKSIGKYLHLENQFKHDTNTLKENDWIKATKTALINNRYILNKVLMNNSNYRDLLNGLENDKKWKKMFGTEITNKLLEYKQHEEPFNRLF